MAGSSILPSGPPSQLYASPAGMRRSNSTSSRWPASGWNGWVTTTNSEPAFCWTDLALCALRCDPQPALLGAAGLGDHPLPHGQGPEAAVLQTGPQLREEHLLAPHGLDVVGGLAVHPGRAGTLVAPHPTPPNQQERRVPYEVVQITEPAVRIVGCPLVQLGLDPQYPRLRLLHRKRRPRRAGVHRRPPSLPATVLRTCCRPSPCGRLSRPPSTTAAPPPPKTHSRRRACPPPAWLAGGKGSPRRVPTFPTSRLTGAVPSFSPAASPRLRRRL